MSNIQMSLKRAVVGSPCKYFYEFIISSSLQYWSEFILVKSHWISFSESWFLSSIVTGSNVTKKSLHLFFDVTMVLKIR